MAAKFANIDHDSTCKCRRENKDLLVGSFHQILELAAAARGIKIGDLTVAIVAIKLLANTTKHSAMSDGHIEEQMKLTVDQIDEILTKAENADSTPLYDGLTIPEEILYASDTFNDRL